MTALPPGPPPQQPPGIPPPGPAPEDSYGAGNVALWAMVTVVALVPIMVVAQLVVVGITGWLFSTVFPDAPGPASGIALAASLLVAIAPIVLAAFMIRRAPSKHRAAPWLGVLIGSALFLIVFGGTCVGLIASMGGL